MSTIKRHSEVFSLTHWEHRVNTHRKVLFLRRDLFVPLETRQRVKSSGFVGTPRVHALRDPSFFLFARGYFPPPNSPGAGRRGRWEVSGHQGVPGCSVGIPGEEATGMAAGACGLTRSGFTVGWRVGTPVGTGWGWGG